MPKSAHDRLRVVTHRELTTGKFVTRKNVKFQVKDGDIPNIDGWATNDEIEIALRGESDQAAVRNITDDTTVRVTIEGKHRLT
jgi:hypothetical protein